MDPHREIFPSPPIVREKLAASLRQTCLLRRLLRLSERAAEERHRKAQSQQGAPTEEGVTP
jgi:hypothetical protein